MNIVVRIDNMDVIVNWDNVIRVKPIIGKVGCTFFYLDGTTEQSETHVADVWKKVQPTNTPAPVVLETTAAVVEPATEEKPARVAWNKGLKGSTVPKSKAPEVVEAPKPQGGTRSAGMFT